MKFRAADLVRRINDLEVDMGIAQSQIVDYERNNDVDAYDEDEYDEDGNQVNYHNLLAIHDGCAELIELFTSQLKALYGE